MVSDSRPSGTPTEEELLINEVADEALEEAGDGARERITFTFSYNPFYSRFCKLAAREGPRPLSK